METYKVNEFQSKMRLDKILVSFMPDKSRSYIAKIIEEGNYQQLIDKKGKFAELVERQRLDNNK